MSKDYSDWDFNDYEANSLLMVTCSEPGISEPSFFSGGDTHHLFLLDDGDGSYTIMKVSEVLGENGRTDWAAADDFVYEDSLVGVYSDPHTALNNFEDEATALYQEFSNDADDDIYFLKRDVKDFLNQLEAEGKNK